MSATATPISSATIWARLVSRYIAEDALADIAVEYHPLPALARGKVRYVDEPVAVVVAESTFAAANDHLLSRRPDRAQ